MVLCRELVGEMDFSWGVIGGSEGSSVVNIGGGSSNGGGGSVAGESNGGKVKNA